LSLAQFYELDCLLLKYAILTDTKKIKTNRNILSMNYLAKLNNIERDTIANNLKRLVNMYKNHPDRLRRILDA